MTIQEIFNQHIEDNQATFAFTEREALDRVHGEVKNTRGWVKTLVVNGIIYNLLLLGESYDKKLKEIIDLYDSSYKTALSKNHPKVAKKYLREKNEVIQSEKEQQEIINTNGILIVNESGLTTVRLNDTEKTFETIPDALKYYFNDLINKDEKKELRVENVIYFGPRLMTAYQKPELELIYKG